MTGIWFHMVSIIYGKAQFKIADKKSKWPLKNKKIEISCTIKIAESLF